MKTKIITAIYSNLHGTDLGGRLSRQGHYYWSLLSLLKMIGKWLSFFLSLSRIIVIKNDR